MRPRLHTLVLALCLTTSSSIMTAQGGAAPGAAAGAAGAGAGGGAAQAGATQASGTITFTVPVNLTQLLADITRVRVSCGVVSEAITVGRFVQKGVLEPGSVSSSQELPVSNGQVVTTVTIVVSVAGVLENPTGKQARYTCSLQGYSNLLQRWSPFNHCFSSATGYECTEAAFRLSPLNPPPNSGTFTW